MFFVLFYAFVNAIQGQECNIELSGTIFDKHENNALEYATIYLEEAFQGGVTDEVGNFNFSKVCPGNYHIIITHLGCETQRLYLSIKKDTSISIFMEHHDNVLDEVIISTSALESVKINAQINKEQLRESSGKNLAEITSQISGVSLIKSGGIAKPIIDGMYGNRISILNNGIVQSGQQWGLDHAPEIDPFVAQNIQVIKGASSIRYGGNNLGGVIMMNPGLPPQDPHIHGSISYVFDSNGYGNTVSSTLEQSNKFLNWRVIGTYKKRGDLKTPDYNLTNTGNREQNIAFQINKTINSALSFDAFYSLFNNQNALLRGAHIGNITDLENAFIREIPFFTEEQFTYNIAVPYQNVQHHLAKIKLKYIVSDNQYLNFTYSFQLNNREEYDVRRGGRSEKPALDLSIFQHYAEIYYKFFNNNYSFEAGIQLSASDNTNIPGTGVLPLIPNYISHNPGAFVIYNREFDKVKLDLGFRYDFKYFNVLRAVQTTIEKNIHKFQNISMDAGIEYKINPSLVLNYNTAFVFRSPEINELYSMGLHQGVSSIEVGNKDLDQEIGFKNILGLQIQAADRFSIDVSTYLQNIKNYIYLAPDKDYRLTIRGAFPVFQYKQTDAQIAGIDFMGKYQILENFEISTKYSIIRGKNKENNLWLVRMPSDNIYNRITFEGKAPGKFKDYKLSFGHQYIWKQNRFNLEEELIAPPKAYHLFETAIYSSFIWKEKELNFGLSIENLFNSTYRDYLDRLRFFSDAPGRNMRINLKYNF